MSLTLPDEDELDRGYMVQDDTGVCRGLTSSAKEMYSCAENF